MQTTLEDYTTGSYEKNTQRRISGRKFTYIRNIYFRLIQTVAQPTETEEGVREWRGNKIGSHQISNVSVINEGSSRSKG